MRPETTTPRVFPSAETTEPAPKKASEMTSIRRLPNMSPSRPKTGVAIAALSRKPVSVQATPASSVPRRSLRSPSAGMSMVWASE